MLFFLPANYLYISKINENLQAFFHHKTDIKNSDKSQHLKDNGLLWDGIKHASIMAT